MMFLITLAVYDYIKHVRAYVHIPPEDTDYE